MSLLARVVDDTASLSPGGLPVAAALAGHREHLAAPYAGLVGSLVVDDDRLPELAALTQDGAADPLRVTVRVGGGAGAIEPAVRWAARAEGVELVALWTTLRGDGGLGDDPARNAARVAAMLEHVSADAPGCETYLAPPRLRDVSEHAWLAALDQIAVAGLRLIFRVDDDLPAPELAACIDAALDRETPFACAGLSRATHRIDPATGHEQHGFLNVLLATRASLDGGDVAAALTAREPASELPSAEACTSARRWFTSFGSSRVGDVHDELVGLGLGDDQDQEER